MIRRAIRRPRLLQPRALLLLLVLFGAGYAVSAAARAVALSPAPALEVVDVTVTTEVVGPGEPVTVEANVRNPSGQEAEMSVALLVDEVPEQERVVRLPARATQTLRFSVVRSEPGAHSVRMGPHAATFQVLSAQLVYRDLILDPPIVAPGELVTVLVTVENTGPAQDMFQIPLAVDGAVVGVRTGLLGAGQTAVVAFETVAKAQGTYTVLVGGLPGEFTSVSPIFDVAIPSSVRLSLPTTTATDKDRKSLAITGDVVTISTASDVVEVTVPVGLPPGNSIASFRDSVSGIVYDGTTLTIPLRDAVYKEVARLVLVPRFITDRGNAVTFTAENVRLLVPSTPMRLPLSASREEPVSFGMEVPLNGMKMNTPLRLVPGLRPPQETLVRIELEARKQGRTIAEVIALAAVELTASAPGAADGSPTVSFGVPSARLQPLGLESLQVALVRPGGAVTLAAIAEAVAVGSQTLLKAKVPEGQGSFLLLVLAKGTPQTIKRLEISSPVTAVGVPVEVRAITEASPARATIGNALLRLNNEPAAVAPVQPQNDGSVAAVFHLPVRAAGTYTIEVDGASAKLHVGLGDVLGHAQAFDLRVNPAKVSPGQAVQVAATVRNVGPREVISEAVLTVNGVPVQQRLLAISAGKELEVRFDLSRKSEGRYEVALLNARTSFAVAREPTPASFLVTDLDVEPGAVESGKPVTVTFILKNTGEAAGVYGTAVFLNKREVRKVELSVGGLTTLPVVFPLQPEGEGIFTVEVAGLRREFFVVSPELRSSLVLESITLLPQTVPGGEPVTVTVGLRNRATAAVDGVLTLLVNGEKVDERRVSLGPRGNVRETFGLVRENPGLYQVEVRAGPSIEVVTGVMKRDFLVTRALTPASWEISGLEITPPVARPQQTVQVSFLVSNLGQQQGEITLRATVDGVQEALQSLRVGPQTTRQVTFTLNGRAEGVYVVAVNGVETKFTVEGAAKASPVVVTPAGLTPAKEAAQPMGNPWPFVGALVGLAALTIGALYGLWRWRGCGRAAP